MDSDIERKYGDALWMREADALLIELGRHAERVDQLRREIDETLGLHQVKAKARI